MKSLVPYALGLIVMALGLAVICALGALWGLLFTALDPAHPERFGMGINFMRGLACTGALGLIVFFGGWAARGIGREVQFQYEVWQDGRRNK